MTAPWLVTGASGLLGANAVRLLRADGPVVGVGRRAVADPSLGFLRHDLAADGAAEALLSEVRPRAVLHCAALASIEACERDPEAARRLNVDATARLAAKAAEEGIPFVAVSTDAVFEGRDGGPHGEDDATAPLSVYARTKLEAEQAALEAHPQALVARVNFSGWSPAGTRGLAEFFYARLAQGRTTNGFDDVTVSTLHVTYLVEALVELVARGAAGVLHVVSSEATTKLEFGRRLAAVFGFDPALVVAARSSDHLTVARGQHLALDTGRAAAILGAPLPGQDAGMALLRAERDAGVPDELTRYAPAGR